MKNRMLRSEKGLTAFELVFSLLVFSVLWLVQLHTFGSVRGEFRQAYEKTVASSVQIGLMSYFVDPKRGDLKKYPPSLDALKPGECNSKRLCFDDVLGNGVTAFWKKTAPLEYLSPASGKRVWKYNPRAGEFLIENGRVKNENPAVGTALGSP